jgi:glutathione synthase/RimK-type ligase-like ATP-grasp enzyme
MVNSTLIIGDIAKVDGKFIIIEVNDNPNIDAGTEDKILKDKLYDIIMEALLNKIKSRK